MLKNKRHGRHCVWHDLDSNITGHSRSSHLKWYCQVLVSVLYKFCLCTVWVSCWNLFSFTKSNYVEAMKEMQGINTSPE